MLLFAKRILQSVPDLVPGTLVLRLLLTPDDFAGIRIIRQQFCVLVDWKWIQLFNTDNGNIRHLMNLTGLREIEINLATAEDNPPDFARVDAAVVRNNEFETAVGQRTQR